jgi:hypothetical protein
MKTDVFLKKKEFTEKTISCGVKLIKECDINDNIALLSDFSLESVVL